MISAESKPTDVYDFAQGLLDRHEEARARVDEARRRAGTATQTCGDLLSRPWSEVENWALTRSRPVRDYVAAVRRAARALGLDDSRAEVMHELAGRNGYVLKRPHGKTGSSAPPPPVGSAIGADLTGKDSWRFGATANRQARYRYLSTTASRPDRPFKFRAGDKIL